MNFRSVRAAWIACALLLCSLPAFAATAPSPPPKAGPLAKVPLRSEYVVSVNGKGEVVRVLSKRLSKFTRFDLMTYGNAVQTFIRTDTGKVVLGTFRLVYTYDPARDAIRRDVELVSRGGVDPKAESAVNVMQKHAAAYTKRDAEALRKYMSAHPRPRPAGSSGPLPPLHDIIGPSPSATP